MQHTFRGRSQRLALLSRIAGEVARGGLAVYLFATIPRISPMRRPSEITREVTRSHARCEELRSRNAIRYDVSRDRT